MTPADEPQRPGLSTADIQLIERVASACARHSSYDLIREVFSLPAATRVRLSELLEGIHDLELTTPYLRSRYIERLVDLLRAAGRHPSLGDALLLDCEDHPPRRPVSAAHRNAVHEDGAASMVAA